MTLPDEGEGGIRRLSLATQVFVVLVVQPLVAAADAGVTLAARRQPFSPVASPSTPLLNLQQCRRSLSAARSAGLRSPAGSSSTRPRSSKTGCARAGRACRSPSSSVSVCPGPAFSSFVLTSLVELRSSLAHRRPHQLYRRRHGRPDPVARPARRLVHRSAKLLGS